MDIQEVKSYLRIDEDYDDSIIEIMMNAAESYIIDSVGAFNPENPKAKILFFLIVQDFYENRVFVVKESDRQRLSHAVGSIISQLQTEELLKDEQ